MKGLKMFNCEGCKTTQAATVKPHRIVAEKRQQTYTNNGVITRGWEIVREINLCDECFEGQPIR